MFVFTKKIAAVICIASVMAACSSTPTNKSLAKEQFSAEKQRQKVAQDRAEDTLDVMPSWALSVPRPDNTGVYAVGIAESDKVQIALKKPICKRNMVWLNYLTKS